MDSLPMMWTPAGSHGLEVVLEPLAKERVFHALKKLQDGSHGPTQASTWQPDHHTPGAHCQFEPLKALFFPAREHIGSWNKAAEHVLWTGHGKYSCFCHFGGSTKWL
jgi:hypothetical protein